MSHDELKVLVDRSSIEERLFLAAYLRHVAAKEDPAQQRTIGDAHREMDQGKKVKLGQLKRLHQSLAKAGL